jgi:hypothetical protein
MGTYTRIPVRIDAIKVPKNAKMQIAQKLEKNVFETKKLTEYQEHNIPSWKSLAKTKNIVVLRFSPREQTYKEKKGLI